MKALLKIIIHFFPENSRLTQSAKVAQMYLCKVLFPIYACVQFQG